MQHELDRGTQRKIPKIKLKVVWGVERSPEAPDVMTLSTSQIVRFISYLYVISSFFFLWRKHS